MFYPDSFKECSIKWSILSFTIYFLYMFAMATISPLFENLSDPIFWVLFVLYIYYHFFFVLHCILSKFNLRSIALYFNPMTWIYFLVLSPYLVCFAKAAQEQPIDNFEYEFYEIAALETINTVGNIEGGTTAIEIFEDIERQTRPLAVIQDKILKSKTTLREDNNCCIWLEPLRKGSFQLQIGCLHMFHFKWIKDWATRENTWPEWREPINVQF